MSLCGRVAPRLALTIEIAIIVSMPKVDRNVNLRVDHNIGHKPLTDAPWANKPQRASVRVGICVSIYHIPV